jgi:hypothetical protein
LPSPGHVAVSLLKDQVDTTDTSDPSKYLTQNLSGVYTNTDPRNYELSAYSYLILPTDTSNNMSTAKGNTIGAFGQYALCLGQSQVDVLGYSALPINLVEAGFTQLAKIPGSTVTAPDISTCNNPTFSPGDSDTSNKLANNDPQPLACDKQGSTQCAQGVAEPTETGAQTGSSGAGSGTTGSTTTSTGTTTGGTSTTTGGTSSTGGTSTTTGGTSSTGGGTSTTGGGTSTTGGKSSTTGGTSSTTGGTSSTTGGASSSTTGTGQNCDPNTGVCSSATGSTTGATGGTTGSGGTVTGSGSEVGNAAGQSASNTPITLAGSNGDGTEVMLMALAAGLMFLLSVVPPLLAQAGRRSRQRRGIDEFYDDERRQGR